jgi:adenylate cyclase
VGGQIDFAAEGFLDGLEGDARAQRTDLLQWLAGEGFDVDQLRRAHRRGLLLFLAAEREVGGEPKHTLEQVAQLSGADPELLTRLRRAQGLPVFEPTEAELTDVDLEGARISQAWVQIGLTEEQMLATTRVIGGGLSRAAEAMRAAMAELVLERGSTERELAERYTAAVHEVMPLVGPMVLQMLSQHLRNMVQTEVAGISDLVAGRVPGARDMTIAFADLVGFTRLGEEIPPEELSQVADRLVALTGDVVDAPVRLVKTIGDAVMLASLEPEPLVQATLALISAVHDVGEDFPQVRVGIAHGAAVARGGDVFGRAVNLASRVTTVARAGSVLGTREVRGATLEAFQWHAAGSRRLKGLPEPVPLYRARILANG